MGDRRIWGVREAPGYSPSNLVVTASLERTALGWPHGILSVTYANLTTGDQEHASIVIDDLTELGDALARYREVHR